MSGVGRAGLLLRRHAVPGHDPVAGLELGQGEGAALIGGAAGLAVGGQAQSPRIGGDGQGLALLGDGLDHMVLGASGVHGDVAHHGQSRGLGRQRQGGRRAVEHVHALALGQVSGVILDAVAAVDPHGLGGEVHHILTVPLRVQPELGGDAVFIPGDLLDGAVVQHIAGIRHRLLSRDRGGDGDGLFGCQSGQRHGAGQRAAEDQDRQLLFHTDRSFLNRVGWMGCLLCPLRRRA